MLEGLLRLRRLANHAARRGRFHLAEFRLGMRERSGMLTLSKPTGKREDGKPCGTEQECYFATV